MRSGAGGGPQSFRAVAATFGYPMMRRTRHLLAVLAVAAIALVAVPVASADPVSDCADGSLDGTYSNDELRSALNNIPADLDAYGDCRAQISGAIRPEAEGAGHLPGQSAPGVPRTPAEIKQHRLRIKQKQQARKAKEKAKKAREIALKIPDAGTKTAAVQTAASANGMPTGLILALVALGLLALAGGLMTLSRRVPAVGEAFRRGPFGRGRR
jgi:hypothetical protein